MNRSEEVRRILSLSVEELVRESRGQLKVMETLDEVYEFLADEMVKEFRKAAAGDKIVSFIMPVGPTQPYRIMAEKINYLNLNLKNVRFFFMDEYCDDNDQLIPATHPLSFRGRSVRCSSTASAPTFSCRRIRSSSPRRKISRTFRK